MEELRDANGLTESEFLAAYDASKYEHPSVTVDIIIVHNSSLLLVRRGGHPCIGKLAFPGGFVEMNEDVYTAARRELMEETSLSARSLRQIGVASEPNRDPRTRIITVPFVAEVEDASALKAGDDAMSARWYNLSLRKMTTPRATIFEIKISDGQTSESVKVQKYYDPSGVRADPIYKTIGESPLAGDHAEILARALDVLNYGE